MLSEVQALAKRRGLVTVPRSVHIQPPVSVLLWGLGLAGEAGSALRMGSPDPVQPSSLREPDAQDCRLFI